MSRLQKKCLIGASTVHGLLLLALLVGPAFFNQRVVENPPLIEIISIPTDGPTRGGTPRAATTPEPPVVQPQPQPQPTPPPPQPEPRREEVKPVRRDTPPPEPPKTSLRNQDAPPEKKPTPKHTIQVSDRKVNLSQRSTTTSRTTTASRNTSQNNELAKAISTTGQRVISGLSPTTRVDLPEGTGGGGVSYTEYGQIVRKVYTDAWRVPDDMNDDEATIKVSVTVARNGTVLASRIVQPSGSAAADRSIQYTLDRIRTIGHPFPAGAKETERTFILTFNLKAKRAFG